MGSSLEYVWTNKTYEVDINEMHSRAVQQRTVDAGLVGTISSFSLDE